MDNLIKEELSVKSFTIKNNNDSSISLYNNIDNATTNQQSKDNQNLNEKIVKLFIGNHPLISMTTIKKISHFNFTNKYLKNEFYYNSIIIDHIIHNDPGHIVAEFKDFLIMGDINEFLQNYYRTRESKYLLPKIYEYYISCSVIFPNYVILPESQYIYKNIQRKQRVIDVQQEQEDKEENIKKGLGKTEKAEEEYVFDTQVLDSILNQTDTSGIKQYFGVTTTEGNSLGGQLSKIIEGINYYEKNKISDLRPKYNNCLYKNKIMDLSNSFFKNRKEQKNNRIIFKEGKIKKKDNNKKTNKSNNINNKFIKNKKLNSTLNKNNVNKLSKSIKIINEISLNNMNNDNILNNGISLKNIISRNKHYNKSKNKNSNKNSKTKGRNCFGSSHQDNYNNFYTTTNSNGGFNNIINITLNNKCNTSRYKYNKKKINEIINNSRNKSKHNSNNNVINPKSLNIIKKSLINSLLNSNKGIEIGNNIKRSNSRSILNTHNKDISKISINGTIFDSITKNSLNISKNKYKKEKVSLKNMNENINNESEYLYFRNKNDNQLLTGLNGNDKNIIYQRKKHNDISYYYNKNKLSNNSSIKNIKIGAKTKNYSSNNILCHKNNLSTSNISSSIRNKYTYKNQKIKFRNKNENINAKEINGNNLNKKDKISNNNLSKKVNNISLHKNDIENKNSNYYISNGFENKNNKNKDTVNVKIKHIKNEKLTKNNELNGIESYKHKNKNSSKILMNNHNKKNSTKFINLDKKMEKKISEKKLRNSYLLHSPKNSLSNKRYLLKSELREKIIKEDIEKPLTVRDSINKTNINNNEAIEILTNKINKIKQYMKESDKRDVNSISHIFKKKKVDRKNIICTQNVFLKDESNGIQLSERTRNRLNKSKVNNTINNIDNNFSEKKIKSIYINNNFNHNNEKNIDKQKRMSNDDINNNLITNNKREIKKSDTNENKIKHYKYCSNLNINNGINNDFSETNNNTNKDKEKNNNQSKTKEQNKNVNNNNINKNKTNESGKNIILLNNDIKSCSLKVLPIKQLNQNKIMVKGIKINGFEKLISKKYTTRNIDIPKSVTDRLKKINGASVISSNHNRYINTSNNRNTKFKKNVNKFLKNNNN